MVRPTRDGPDDVTALFTGSGAAWSARTLRASLQSGARVWAWVGDGQAPGVLDTGRLSDLPHRTKTIAENAAVLRDYIAGVKRLTGATEVDLVAHSLGGLIARYYLDRLMPERDVARLIMLGTPNGGSDCASLPAALGFSAPATLELRPDYAPALDSVARLERMGVR